MKPSLTLGFHCDLILLCKDRVILIDGQHIAQVRDIRSMRQLSAVSHGSHFQESGFIKTDTDFKRIDMTALAAQTDENPLLCLARLLTHRHKRRAIDLAIVSRYLPDGIALSNVCGPETEVWCTAAQVRTWPIPSDVPISGLPAETARFVGGASPVTAVQDLPPRVAIDYPLYSSIAHHVAPSLEDAYLGTRYFGSGYGESQEVARFKAVMEALERYSSGFVPLDVVVPAATSSLLEDPRLFDFLGIDQAAYLRGELFCKPPAAESYPTVNATVFSAHGKSQPWSIPYDMAYYPVRPGTRERFVVGNSSGIAVHQSWEEAVGNAFAEYVERHDLLLHWASGKSPLRLQRSSLPEELQKRMEALESLPGGGDMHLLAMKGATFVTIVACLIRKGWPSFHLGSAAHWNATVAAQKSLDELANAVMSCEVFWEQTHVDGVYDAVDHYCYYHDPRRAGSATRWATGGSPLRWQSVEETKTREANDLLALGAREFGDIAVVDLTAPTLATMGLTAVRVMTERGLPTWFGDSGLPNNKAIWKRWGARADRWIHPLG
jgi:thiazole/oxazole-forming peptide maturase SagD family component